jgi:hypothetical protein
MATALAEAHVAAQERLRAIVAQALTAAWLGLASYDREDVDGWLGQVVPFILAAQLQSAALTNAFVGMAMGRSPLAIDPTRVTGAAIRNGAEPAEVYARPFVTVWTALSNGTEWDQAVSAGLARATSTGEMDMQLASRATYAEVQRLDESIRGYRRVADSTACDFCRLIDGALVKSASASPLHNRCGCGLEPVIEIGTPSPLPETVAVHEHGELGAVLTDAAHHFETL